MRYRNDYDAESTSNDYDAESTSNLITFDYDAVIQLPKVASEAGKKLRVMSVSSVPPCPRSVPRVGMVPPPPCERKHSVTPNVSSVTPSSVGSLWSTKKYNDYSRL